MLSDIYYVDKTYEQSKSGDNDYHIIEMRWYEDPRYNKDLSWFKPVEGDEDNIVEFETEFTKDSYLKRLEDDWKPTSSWYEEMRVCITLSRLLLFPPYKKYEEKFVQLDICCPKMIIIVIGLL